MPPVCFDPLDHRSDRDLRNHFSQALARSLETLAPEPLDDFLAAAMAGGPSGGQEAYLAGRADAARAVVATCRLQGCARPLDQALTLMEAGLFFEAHERLEAAWQPATGDRRLALKALIQLCGSREHALWGHDQTARSLERRGSELWAAHRAGIPADLARRLEAALAVPAVAPATRGA